MTFISPSISRHPNRAHKLSICFFRQFPSQCWLNLQIPSFNLLSLKWLSLRTNSGMCITTASSSVISRRPKKKSEKHIACISEFVSCSSTVVKWAAFAPPCSMFCSVIQQLVTYHPCPMTSCNLYLILEVIQFSSCVIRVWDDSKNYQLANNC